MSGLNKADFTAGRVVVQPPMAADGAGYFGRDWPAFWRRLNTRRMLLKLDEQQLKDIGLSRAQAEHEANRPFWTL